MNSIIKTLITAVSIATGTLVYAAIPEYQVYDVKLSVRTTEGKGVTTITSGCSADDEYVYRDKKNIVVKGLIAGCGCGAILADGACNNARLYLWDETHKVAITNVEFETDWRVQVIGKTQKVVENFARIKATYGENDEYSFDITLCGFGTHKKDSKNYDLSYVPSISGYFAGTAVAPYYYKGGKCTACSVEPDVLEPTVALAMCGCTDNEGEVSADTTPFGGTYTVKYNSTKSKKASKSGISQAIFGLPAYVGIDDFIVQGDGE